MASSRECETIKTTLWENRKRMHEARDQDEYHHYAWVSWLGMNAFLHHCPETANADINKMFEEIREMKPGPYLEKVFREAIPELLREMK